MTTAVQQVIAANEAQLEADRGAHGSKAYGGGDRADFEEAARILKITPREIKRIELEPGLGVCVQTATDDAWYAILEPALIAEAGGAGLVSLTAKHTIGPVPAYRSPTAKKFLLRMRVPQLGWNEED